jgi:hypothetical protein
LIFLNFFFYIFSNVKLESKSQDHWQLGSSNWHHSLRFGVLHLTWYSKFESFEISWITILKNSWKSQQWPYWCVLEFSKLSPAQKSAILTFLRKKSNFSICPFTYSLPKLYSFLGRYETSFYANRCVRFFCFSNNFILIDSKF